MREEISAATRKAGLVVDLVSSGGAADKSTRWRFGHTAGLSFLVAAIVAICLLFPRFASGGENFGTWRLASWLLIMALLSLLFVLIGRGVIGLWTA